jgi:hypothetical protein
MKNRFSILPILTISTIGINVSAFTPTSSRIIRTPESILRSSNQNEIDSSTENPVASFFENFNFGQKRSNPVETEDERLKRLKREALAELEEKEVERANQVQKDALPYLFLLALQFLPLLGTDRIDSISYFWGVATATVYVGGRQVTLQESEKVSSESALYAPLGASVSIGLLYVLIKAGLNPAALYAFGVTAFGALAISDVSVPLLRNILPSSFADSKVKLPEKISSKLGLGDEDLPLDGLTALILGIGCTAAYWSPFAMEHKFLVSNCEYIVQPNHEETCLLFIIQYFPHNEILSYCMGPCNDLPWSYFFGFLSNGSNSSCWFILLRYFLGIRH